MVSRCFGHLPPRTDDSLGGEPHSLHVQEQTTQYILWVEKPFSLLLPGKKANSQSFHMSKENRPLGTCRQRRLWRKEKGEYVVLDLRLHVLTSILPKGSSLTRMITSTLLQDHQFRLTFFSGDCRPRRTMLFHPLAT